MNSPPAGMTNDRNCMLRRACGMAAALSAIALVASACSGGSGPGGSAASSSGPATYQQTVAYSQYMRGHGDPGFPDPQQGPGGAWLYPETPQTRQYFPGPGYNAAQQACKKLQPKGGLTPAERQAAINQLLELARCMRARGITSFPDPTTRGGGVGISLGGSGIDPNSPQFQGAQKACHMPRP
jgi:hypothetical protein